MRKRQHHHSGSDAVHMPPIAGLVSAMRAGRTTAVAVVDGCLERIHRHDAAIRAWVVVDEDGARRRAEELDALARTGRLAGPLHGVPIGVKDIVDVAGLPTRCGSPLCGDEPAAEDATVVARLRAAGAIILGKTVTTEWAGFDPPPTRNPWNLKHTPGGSSSGSAAAVAAGMCAAALGTQTGGSIIRPAAYCGLVGLKPTFGRVSRHGVAPFAGSLDHVGPFGLRVADVARVFAVIAGHDPRDPASMDQPCDDYLRELSRTEPPLLGTMENDPLSLRSDDHTRGAVSQAMSQFLRRSGSFSPVRLPPAFPDVHAMHYRIMSHEAVQVHRAAFERAPQRFGPKISAVLRDGLACSEIDYRVAIEHQRRFREEMVEAFGDCEALLTVAATSTAPADLTTTGDPFANSPWSYAGLPVVTVPVSLAPNGLPCGIQLIGRQWSEAALLGIAAWYEQQRPWPHAPPERAWSG